MLCIACLFNLNVWQRLIEAIQELICLKGVLLNEMGIHLVDPITFMDDVKSATTLSNTYEDGMIHLEHCVTRTW